MSGCYPGTLQSMPSCIHGKVDYCFKCERTVMDKIKELYQQIMALTDMYKSISIQCAANHDYKLRQIDENRKISRRVDELESENKMRQDTIGCMDQAYNDAFLNCEKRLNELEKMANVAIDNNPIKDIYDKFEKIESKIADFMQKSNLNCEKWPFKCPVCDGSIKILIDPETPMSGIQAMFGKKDINGMYYKDCISCDGKGIVWR